MQELVQEKHKVTPTYRVLKEEGPDHDKIFTVGVFIDSNQIGQGSGKSKQDAESQAATAAIPQYTDPAS